MAQWVKTLASKAGDMNSFLGPHSRRKETTCAGCSLTSTLHIQVNKCNKIKKE